MENVCPKPDLWHSIYERLLTACDKANGSIPKPPVPLILGGWAYSNDVEKRSRWYATLEWAERWGLSHLIGEISPDMMYAVDSLSDCQTGPAGGPMYLAWNLVPRPKTSDESATRAVECLRMRWNEIAGETLASATKPLRLTGKKRRRLVVFARSEFSPPWGTWNALGSGEERRSFTSFRAAVNAAIYPVEVDHIEFIHELTLSTVPEPR